MIFLRFIRRARLRRMIVLCCALLLPALADAQAAPPTQTIPIELDAQAAGTPFPHFWERMFGSGHAVLALRASYRRDLSMVKRATGFDYVRFHGIFDRHVGLFHLGKDGKPVYNFSLVDQIYDGLLARGVKPYVELGFMPRELAADPADTNGFWYHPITSPPKSYKLWDGMIQAFARHLIARYGIDEVSTWYFEVWNEPNLNFWAGKPKQATYFKLYANTARALKEVSPRLRVGGPATAQAAWVPQFLDYMHAHDVPVDFVSAHTYGDDTAQNVFHKDEHIPRRAMVCDAVAKVDREIAQSPYPHLPLIYSEYNATYMNLPNVTDSAYMGPYLAETVDRCAGKVTMMSYWTFSDVFEEQGVVKTPFYGGYGLVSAYGMRKPAFNAFALLHKLGHARLPVQGDDVIATRRRDGTLALALWNYAPPVNLTPRYVDRAPSAPDKRFDVRIAHLAAGSYATLWRVGRHHADVMRLYDAMGRPAYPTPAQTGQLRRAGMLAPPQVLPIRDGHIEVTLPPYGLALLEVRA
ncbi:MAG: glycosyl hydrolase family 39 [Metallibacterium scheffleri]|jgi:xylan 1,4-beta-xylosidase|uniref:GH39 family glycosyl hydrolase n=1 Tax=Metallibacterium scheffleri TaxID=993689 RepID=UPI0026F3754F|nr:glycosyl hydrolase family 39 [Metallibacterium scheffleri]MCK9367667.1 glycosyl hydrolase family 39 [Metallibacterium scheffleri]